MNEPAHAFSAARRIFRLGVDPATFVATFFLPRAKRDALHAVGAFVHLTIDALTQATVQQPCDAGCGPTHADEILTLARQRIEAVFADKLELPRPEFRDEGQWALHAAARSVQRYEIPIQPMLGLLEGLVAEPSMMRYATWRSLGEHCRRTGGNIAELVSAILGATHSDMAHYASQIGQAAWLARILRGLRKDLVIGRVSLPLEDLVSVRCGEKDLLALRATDESRELIRLEVARARELFHAGAEGLCWLAGDGSRLAAATFVSGELALLDAIERDPSSVLRDDVRVSPARRLRRLPHAWRLAKRQAAEPLPRFN